MTDVKKDQKPRDHTGALAFSFQSACDDQASFPGTFRKTSSRLLEGGDASLSDLDIILGGATGSHRADTMTVHHYREAPRNSDKGTWTCCQGNGDGMMIISFISAWAFFP